MQSGTMRAVVTLERPRPGAPSRDAYGEALPPWEEVLAGNGAATRRAEVTPLSGREFWQARQVQAETTHRVRVRWAPELAGLTSAWRVVLAGGRVLQIESALNAGERDRVWELMCREVVSP